MQDALHQSSQFKDPKLLHLNDNNNNKNGMHGLRIRSFMKMRIEATLRDMMRNLLKDVEEYAYHLEQSKNYMENQIVWESRQEDIRRSKPYAHVFYVYKYNHKRVRNNLEEYFSDHKIVEVVRVTIKQQHGLDYMEQIIVMRENDKPDTFSEADFKYLNKNDIEDMYYLCLNKKLGIESYQIKINLTAPTLIFPGIEACDPYSIVDKLITGLIYLHIKNEKMVMDLIDISKFCEATLERVLKEVKLKIFETEFLKKVQLLGELDHDIMKACEREITKHLRHHGQMRRWESFVNGRPILPMMRRK
ncbi:hypothetical protein Tco_0174118 [Tanacetum coccineum]